MEYNSFVQIPAFTLYDFVSPNDQLDFLSITIYSPI